MHDIAMDIGSLLLMPEGKGIEFKENTRSKDKILATVISFANTSGGKIMIGIEDKTKKIVGVSDPYLEEEKLSTMLSDSVTPTLLFNVEILPWRGTYILIIDVPMSSHKPHYIRSKGIETSTYIRVGSTNRVADSFMVESIRRSLISKSFDEDICFGCSCDDLDISSIAQAFEPIRKTTERDLLSLGIKIKDRETARPSVGGILCFGKAKEAYFPDAWIQAGCFQGTNKNIILDSLDIKTHLSISVEQALNFIRKHIKVGLDIQEIAHTERWEIPKKALREAILNAVIHTDYSLRGAPLRVAIFDDRVEIDNPGLIPSGLTLDDIKGGLSKIRNRVISRIFRELKQSEQWGSGIRRIIDTCLGVGLQAPNFEEIGDRFRVILFRHKVAPILLDDKDQEILSFLKVNGPSATKDIARVTHLSERSVRPRVTKLIEKGFIIEISKSHNDPKKKFIYVENEQL